MVFFWRLAVVFEQSLCQTGLPRQFVCEHAWVDNTGAPLAKDRLGPSVLVNGVLILTWGCTLLWDELFLGN